MKNINYSIAKTQLKKKIKHNKFIFRLLLMITLTVLPVLITFTMIMISNIVDSVKAKL